jgi:hypothetical protein
MSDVKDLEKMSLSEAPAVGGGEEEDVVNPWEVSTQSAKGVDYDKLISKSLL